MFLLMFVKLIEKYPHFSICDNRKLNYWVKLCKSKGRIIYLFLLVTVFALHGAKNTRLSRYFAPTVRVVVRLFTFAWSSRVSTWFPA